MSDSWVIFDFLIIVISWITFDPTGEGESGVQVIRSLRIFRILSRIESLKKVLAAIGRSLPRLGALGIFLGLIMFIFGIFFTEQYKNMYENGQTDYDYFSRLDYTFFTLYQLLTLDAWTDVLYNMMETYPSAWIPVVLYIILTAFVIVNLAIAIICEAMFELIVLDAEEKREKEESVQMEILSMCHELCDILEVSTAPQEVITKKKKSEVEENTTKAATTSLAKARKLCGRIVNDKYVQGVVIFVILVNSVLIALGTFDFVADDPSLYSALEIVNYVFLGLYTVESAMQLFYHGLQLFKDGWLTFDFILITLSWSLALSPAFRVFRVLRLVHVLPKLKAMRTITGTLFNAIPKISAIGGILLIFFYVFAVMFTTLFKDVPLSGDYFSRLDKSLLTLFQIMTMANWSSLTRELGEHVKYAPFLTTSFLTISGLLFINAIVALICEAHESLEDGDEEGTEMSGTHGSDRNLSQREIEERNQLIEIKLLHKEILRSLKSRDILLKAKAQDQSEIDRGRTA